MSRLFDDVSRAAYDLVMSRPHSSQSLGIAELKAGLSDAIRRVRKGETITVYDRNVPVASLGPLQDRSGLVVRPAVGRPGEVRLPPPLGEEGSLAALEDERRDRDLIGEATPSGRSHEGPRKRR